MKTEVQKNPWNADPLNINGRRPQPPSLKSRYKHDSVEVLCDAGFYEISKGNIEDARGPLRMAWKLGPGCLRAAMGMSQLDNDGTPRGKSRAASYLVKFLELHWGRKQSTDIIEWTEVRAKTYVEIGKIFSEVGTSAGAARVEERERALGAFDSALHFKPRSVPALLGRAKICIENDLFDDALRASHLVQKLEPGNPLALCNIAAIYALRGDLDGARSIYGKVIRTEPQMKRALLGLALIEVEKGDVAKGIDTLKQLVLRNRIGAALYAIDTFAKEGNRVAQIALQEIVTSAIPFPVPAKFPLSTPEDFLISALAGKHMLDTLSSSESLGIGTRRVAAGRY